MAEKLTVVDENDVPVGEATKAEIVRSVLNYRCVHMFIFNKKGELLIGKRPKFKRRFPDKWTSAAGGKVSSGESYERAAYREMDEEIGIKTPLKKHCKFSYINEFYGYTVFHELYVGEFEGPFKLAADEVKRVKWISIEEVKKDVEENPEKYATPFIAALKSYIENL
ncbi:NUDIX domain-containing protein [Candidatus Woesearchaeota archaeon]|nr:NUDIX domain-containing protein [Candidatus Woesearchaeota archaeon]